MSTHDFPDWQGGENTRSPVLLNIAAHTLLTGTEVVLANTPTVHYPYLICYGRVQGNNGQLDVFFSDIAGTQQVLDTRFIIAANVFVYTVPVMLDQVQIQVNRAAGAAATMDLYVALTEVPYYKTQLSHENVLTLASSAALAQNASQEFTFFPYTGFAVVEAESTQSNFTMRLKCYDLDGSTLLGRSWFQNTGTQGMAAQVWLPPTYNTLAVTNNNAAAATITVQGFAQSAVPK